MSGVSNPRRLSKPTLAKWVGTVLIIVAIFFSALTLGLGGKVPHASIKIVDASNYALPLYGELRSNVTVGYFENFVGWHFAQTSPVIDAKSASSPEQLILGGSIQNASAPSSIAIVKSALIDIATYPILAAEVNVTKSVSYGLRFFGQYPNGSQFDVWWDGSTLDHRPGNGFETLRINMLEQAFLATGRSLSTLSGLEIYAESRANNPTNFVLELNKLTFSTGTFSTMKDQDYRAVYIDLGNSVGGNTSWPLNRIQIGITISATSNTTFTLYLFDGHTLFTTLETPSSYRYSQLSPAYDLVFYPTESRGAFPELLPRSNASFVLVATSGSLTNASLNYVDIVYLPSSESTLDPSQSSLGLYFVYFIFFLFLLPIGVSLLVYQEFLRGKSATLSEVVACFATGLAFRFALAPVAILAFDMNVLLRTSAYYLLGSKALTMLPSIESVRNGPQILTIMVTILAGLFVAYLKDVRGNTTETLIRSSLFVLGSFVLVYFWLGVYPI